MNKFPMPNTWGHGTDCTDCQEARRKYFDLGERPDGFAVLIVETQSEGVEFAAKLVFCEMHWNPISQFLVESLAQSKKEPTLT